MLKVIEQHDPSHDLAKKSLAPKRIDVSFSLNIRADVRRIMYALTIPEYMEVWMHVPNVDRMMCAEEDRPEAEFRLDLICSEKIESSIHCRRLLIAPGHLKFFWKEAIGGGEGQSTVDIRMKQNKTSCVVIVKHTGLGGAQDSCWYSTLWQRSLENLRRLLEA